MTTVHHVTSRDATPATVTNPAWAGTSRDRRPIRENVVFAAKTMIARGEMDTPERWEATLDRLADAMLR